MLLIVEDQPIVAKLWQRNLQKAFPDLVFAFVMDAENAQAALEGRKYQEWNPMTREFIERDPVQIQAVLWDNCFPRNRNGKPESDMGLTLIHALQTSAKISQHVLSHFISASSDADREKFEKPGLFAKIFPKQFDLEELRPLFLKWGLIAGGSPVWTPNTRNRRLNDEGRIR